MIESSTQSTDSPRWRRSWYRATKYALLYVAALAVPLGGPIDPKEAVIWIESYDEALAEARLTGKPIFLEFRCAP